MDHGPSPNPVDPHASRRILIASPANGPHMRLWDHLGGTAHDMVVETLAQPTSLDDGPSLVVWPVLDAVGLHNDIARLNLRFPGVPLVAVSDPDNARLGWHALRQGFRGYLPSTASPWIVAAGLRLVLAGGLFIPDLMLRDQQAFDDCDPARLDRAAILTGREAEVLQRLRRGLQNKLIAYELGISQSTVKVHVRSIMRKTAATNRTQIVCLMGGLRGVPQFQYTGGVRP